MGEVAVIADQDRATPPIANGWPRVVCDCKRIIFDGEVIHARVINVRACMAKCRCSRWVRVPIGYAPI